MARPTKQGIDYFPIDVQFDDKIELYLLEKEGAGLAVLVTLWQIIYQNEGYFVLNGKDLFLLIKKRINVDINEIESCIKLAIDRGIFNKTYYKKYKILTSRAIQKRYFDAAKRKKEVRYDKRYIINGINVGDNSINVLHQSPNVNVNVNVKNIYTHPLQKFIYENLKQVAKLGIPTEKELDMLISKYSQDLIIDKLWAMENKRDLLKKYNSTYLTLNNWCKNGKDKGQNAGSVRSRLDYRFNESNAKKRLEEIRGMFG